MSQLESLASVQLWALLDRFEDRLRADLASMGLTVASFRLIGELMYEPEGLRQSELARRLRVRPPTVSTAVTRLEQDGLVRRLPDPDDPRAWRVCLEKDASLDAGFDILAGIDATLTQNLSASETKTLHRLLGKLIANLEPNES